MSGILTPYFDEIATRERFADAVAGMTEAQRDQAAALALGISAEAMTELGAYAVTQLQQDVRRDAQRERVWEIERQVCERIPAEVSAEIDRATAGGPIIRTDHSEATRKQYAADQAHFGAFCANHGVAPMPAEPSVLALYILETAPAPALMRRRLAALADLHRQCARILPRKHAIVLAAIRHVKEATKQGTEDNGEAPRT